MTAKFAGGDKFKCCKYSGDWTVWKKKLKYLLCTLFNPNLDHFKMVAIQSILNESMVKVFLGLM